MERQFYERLLKSKPSIEKLYIENKSDLSKLSTLSELLTLYHLKKRATKRSRRAREPSRIPLAFLRGLNKKYSMLKNFVFKKISKIEIPKSSKLHRYVHKLRKLYHARYKCNNKRDPNIIYVNKIAIPKKAYLLSFFSRHYHTLYRTLKLPMVSQARWRKNLFNFIWKNKKDRIKRTTLYQDLEKGGIRMTDVDLMFRSLRLAWIPRLLTAGDCNWCTVPYHFFRKLGGLNFLLKCDYDPKHLPQLPIFYRNILQFFKELKAIYWYDQGSDLVFIDQQRNSCG